MRPWKARTSRNTSCLFAPQASRLSLSRHLIRYQRRLAGDAFPFAVLIEPNVGKAPAPREGLALFCSLVPVDSRAHRHVVAVHAHRHTLVVNLFSDNVRTLHLR